MDNFTYKTRLFALVKVSHELYYLIEPWPGENVKISIKGKVTLGEIFPRPCLIVVCHSLIGNFYYTSSRNLIRELEREKVAREQVTPIYAIAHNDPIGKVLLGKKSKKLLPKVFLWTGKKVHASWSKPDSQDIREMFKLYGSPEWGE